MTNKKYVPSSHRPARDDTVECLRCWKPFKSWDKKKNRICPKCDAINAQITTKTSVQDMPNRATKLPSH